MKTYELKIPYAYKEYDRDVALFMGEELYKLPPLDECCGYDILDHIENVSAELRDRHQKNAHRKRLRKQRRCKLEY